MQILKGKYKLSHLDLIYKALRILNMSNMKTYKLYIILLSKERNYLLNLGHSQIYKDISLNEYLKDSFKGTGCNYFRLNLSMRHNF